jgi:ABC-type Fe3+ transport system permease subunit
MKHWVPLIGFVVPSLVIGYGFMIPRSCIAGVNDLSIGFGATIAAACVTYVLGVRSALKATTRHFTQ